MKTKNTCKFIILTSIAILAVLFFGHKFVAKASSGEPIAWWDFNNQSEISAGLVRDKINSYNGQNLNGTPTSGYSGGALYFDLSSISGVPGSGGGDGFTVAGLPQLSQLTITFRMKTDNSTDATQSVIIAQSISPTYGEFNIQYKNGALGVGVTNNGGAGTTLNINQNYHYYAVSYDGRNVYVYVDGQVKGFGTATGTGKVTADKWSFVSNGFIDSQNNIVNKITIDDLKIYNRVLSEAEVSYENESGQLCYADTWSCGEYSACSINGTQTRICNKTFDCPLVDTQSPTTSQSCTPPCSEDTWSCGDWNSCSASGTQNRTCSKTFDCSSANTPSPTTSQSCTPPCTSDTWSCGDWNTCSIYGSQTRNCNKTSDCATADTPSPSTSQNCTPLRPSCSADTWTCSAWNACSLSGIQNRNCTKTFDCPDVETSSPIIDQYCEAPNRPSQQVPQSGSDEILNQDSIIKSTVKLLCPVDAQKASQGSGTVIDSSGIILTNKHVIAGTLGCLVGFINDFNDEPYFGERQIADILKVSPSNDIAILKIRNPQNKSLSSVDITKGNSDLRLGTKITIYGYPAKFGTKVTYTSGDFSGTDGSYLKTTAILEYGNSGGGSYLKDGTFIGIPSAVVKGELNALGYILSVNTIKAWLGNSNIASNSTNNNYSRVSVLENIDLKKLNSLKLFIPNTDDKGNLSAPAINQNSPKVKESQPSQMQGESIVIESADQNQKVAQDQGSVQQETKQEPKISWLKRLWRWFINLF
jgi:S1-C subfamily serine protease